MTDFGDYETADAFDTEPADPEQVARKLQTLRVAEGLSTTNWDDDLTDGAKLVRIVVVGRLLDWLRRQGAT